MRLAVKDSLCSGCRVCQVACSLSVFRENNPKKGLLKIDGRFPVPGKYEVRYCTQCGKCAEVCPVEAITMEGEAYRIDPELCIGCMKCVQECPENVMITFEGSDVPSKCILCGACVEMCPRGAIYDADAGEGGS
ncbi:MAG: 4Fe-4S binding protein [Firmicutes bacterium]|jgi:formate hydrogenlyase subunit 6/NADH:ubiquinone oxidoreductase subunit I|nr:4Fe-4S binding protein [Bacillota bacterium]